MDIVFGAVSDPLHDQLSAQGLRVDNMAALLHLEADAKAVTRLNVRGMIPDSVAHAARKKIMKAIVALKPRAVKPWEIANR